MSSLISSSLYKEDAEHHPLGKMSYLMTTAMLGIKSGCDMGNVDHLMEKFSYLDDRLSTVEQVGYSSDYINALTLARDLVELEIEATEKRTFDEIHEKQEKMIKSYIRDIIVKGRIPRTSKDIGITMDGFRIAYHRIRMGIKELVMILEG